MMGRRARQAVAMGRELFWSAVALGALCGTAAVAIVLQLGTVDSASNGGIDAAYFADVLVMLLPIALLGGMALGILCWAAAYAAVGILEARRPEATVLQQSAAGALGSLVGGLLPAILIFSRVFSDAPNLPFVYGAAYGLPVLCFLLAFGTLLVLNHAKNRVAPAG